MVWYGMVWLAARVLLHDVARRPKPHRNAKHHSSHSRLGYAHKACSLEE